MSLSLAALLALAAILALAAAARARTVRERRREGAAIARELRPEIRALMQACDPSGSEASAREPSVAKQYQRYRQRIAGRLPEETLFAVETFYQCFEAQREAERAMRAAFAAGDAFSLGDRIRAKDRRDRSLKDVYYTGEAALQKLGELSGNDA